MKVLLRRIVPLLATASCAVPPTPSPPPELPLPPRSIAAATGSQISTRIADMSLRDRERLLEEQILLGNVPTALRQLQPITVAATVQGTVRTVTYYVTADYLAVGSNADFLRTPLTAPAAQRIADRLGCMLPTRKIVDDVQRAAAVRVPPRSFHPDEHDITSVAVFTASHRAIEEARAGRPGVLSGGKKDIVISPLLANNGGRVVIYGWHRLDGTAIQPLSKVHVDSYVDYSHGVRLVWRRAVVDGQERELPALLSDPDLWPLVSDEGPFGSWRYSERSP